MARYTRLTRVATRGVKQPNVYGSRAALDSAVSRANAGSVQEHSGDVTAEPLKIGTSLHVAAVPQSPLDASWAHVATLLPEVRPVPLKCARRRWVLLQPSLNTRVPRSERVAGLLRASRTRSGGESHSGTKVTSEACDGRGEW